MAFGSVLYSGKHLNLVCGALNADKASFWHMPLLPLQQFGLFCSQPGLLSLFLRLGWAGVWEIMQRAGNDLVSGTANKLLFVSSPCPVGQRVRTGCSSDFLGAVGDTVDRVI